MKKLLIFIIVLALLGAMSVTCLAEEVANETVNEASVFDRLWEWVSTYTAEIAAGGCATIMLGALITFWKKIKLILTTIVEGIKKIFSACNDAADVQDKHSGALNGLIDMLNDTKTRIAQLEAKLTSVESKESEESEHFKHIQESLKSLAMLFDTVYSNSKLPQGTKDMVHVSCAECIRIADREINGDIEVTTDEQQA